MALDTGVAKRVISSMASGHLCVRHYVLLGVLLLAVFAPVLGAEFLNWDDPAFLTENDAVLAFDIPRIFASTVLDLYLPLTILSFAVEKVVFGLDPFIFHLNNLILHFGVCALLMGFFTRLGASARAAFLGALIFAVHPVHADSVAWVTERKDVLYALFYVLALRQWWAYLQERKAADLRLTLAWGLLSLLAKPMAVSLPLVMLFLEWWRAGSVRRIRWMAYLPMAMLALGIGALTYVHHMRNPVDDPLAAGLIWVWSLGFYIWKFFFPVVVHPFYLLPVPVHWQEPAYFFSVVLVGSLAWILARAAVRHSDRWLVLAAGFFFLSIFFLLRLDGQDVQVVANRFMYLPSAGICLWLGVRADEVLAHDGPARSYRPLAWTAVILAFCFLAVRTFTYLPAWHSSFALWDDVVRHYPQLPLAYMNRGVAHGTAGRHAMAIADQSVALKADFQTPTVLYNLGFNYARWAEQERRKAGGQASSGIDRLYVCALEHYDASLRLHPQHARALAGRAEVRDYFHDQAGALEDLDQALAINPGFSRAHRLRSQIRARTPGRTEKREK